MSRPAVSALYAHESRVAGMLADPECVGELLLVGVALARGVDLDQPAPIGDGYRLRDVGLALYGTVVIPADLALPAGGRHVRRYADRGWRRIYGVLRADIRRYEPTGPGFHNVTCGRPRVRTDGLCGRDASGNYTRQLVDPATGERVYVGACSNVACRAWFDGVVAGNERELADHPAPVPPANIGGILERHLPEIDWWAIWRYLDKDWTPPPEDETWHHPKLQLLLGDDDSDPSPTVPRPALTVLRGGW